MNMKVTKVEAIDDRMEITVAEGGTTVKLVFPGDVRSRVELTSQGWARVEMSCTPRTSEVPPKRLNTSPSLD